MYLSQYDTEALGVRTVCVCVCGMHGVWVSKIPHVETDVFEQLNQLTRAQNRTHGKLAGSAGGL